jgi:hypothetical protein
MSDDNEKTSQPGGERPNPSYIPEIREADTLNSPPIPLRPSKDAEGDCGGSGSGKSAEK